MDEYHDPVTIKIEREDLEAMIGDLHRASTWAVLQVANQEAQGIASDLNAILAVLEDA